MLTVTKIITIMVLLKTARDKKMETKYEYRVRWDNASGHRHLEQKTRADAICIYLQVKAVGVACKNLHIYRKPVGAEDICYEDISKEVEQFIKD